MYNVPELNTYFRYYYVDEGMRDDVADGSSPIRNIDGVVTLRSVLLRRAAGTIAKPGQHPFVWTVTNQ